MTNPTPHGQVPEALLLADQYAAAHAKWELEDLYGSSKSYTAEKLAERHAARANLERALHAAHVQNPAEIEHVAGDVSKNGAGSNTSQQPAPATQKLKEQICISDINQSAACAVGSVGTKSDAQTTRSTHDVPATQQVGERVYAFRRKGLADFCTCDEARYEELSNNPHLFETRIFYAAPQPSPTAQAADSVLEDAGGANWQDISTAPKDGTRFVAVGQNYGLDSEAQHTCIAQWLAGCWVEVSDWNGASKLKYLTHWMPLPPLPGSAARATPQPATADEVRFYSF